MFSFADLQSPMLQLIVDYLQNKEFKPQDKEDCKCDMITS